MSEVQPSGRLARGRGPMASGSHHWLRGRPRGLSVTRSTCRPRSGAAMNGGVRPDAGWHPRRRRERVASAWLSLGRTARCRRSATGRQPPQRLPDATAARGSKGSASIPSPAPMYTHWVGWLMTLNGVMSQPSCDRSLAPGKFCSSPVSSPALVRWWSLRWRPGVGPSCSVDLPSGSGVIERGPGPFGSAPGRRAGTFGDETGFAAWLSLIGRVSAVFVGSRGPSRSRVEFRHRRTIAGRKRARSRRPGRSPAQRGAERQRSRLDGGEHARMLCRPTMPCGWAPSAAISAAGAGGHSAIAGRSRGMARRSSAIVC